MKRGDYNDNEILIECLKGDDKNAFTYLIDSYHNRLCVYANSLVKNIYNAEDIVQNVFLRTWEQRSQLKSNHSIKSFLYKSVYNEFIDQYRKNQYLISLEKSYFDALNEVVSEDNSETINEVITVVKKEIQNLPPRCKEVFILSKQEGLTNIEIAEYLNVSIKTVEAQITKAFSILRLTMAEKVKGFLFLLFGYKKSIFRN
ncbi:RNA polymerase sigma factor [Flavobacterium solisilvae]|uniref:RNA polymerase sigma-70 factor n=1 Tax=Flavobacterium solisilvae TaxID=1852019 RepID=A0ABX1QSU3_9FLAO|nr:RNA polymerase sigma-70 factor [Flavobacterium solisilvae]NMH24239.1 RNA polymerase sigma-70 factor [Flavobacterium solisilvae]